MTYFIISITAEDGEVQYVTKGEYSTFALTYYEQNAVRFNSISEVEEAIKSRDFTKRNIYSDNSSSPPSIIWTGLGICNARKKSSGEIKILKYVPEVVSSILVQDGIID